MTTISTAARGVRRAGVMVVAAMAVTALSHTQVEALSLASPAALPAAKHASEGTTIEVRGGHGGGHGGFHGGGFHGGGFHGGGVHAFHGGGFRAAHIGGGFRAAHVGGFRHHHAFFRPHHFRHFHHRRFFAGYYPGYYAYPYCRVVWTSWGPRKVCPYRPWYNNYAYW